MYKFLAVVCFAVVSTGVGLVCYNRGRQDGREDGEVFYGDQKEELDNLNKRVDDLNSSLESANAAISIEETKLAKAKAALVELKKRKAPKAAKTSKRKLKAVRGGRA